MVFDLRRHQWESFAKAGRTNDLDWSRNSDQLYFLDLLSPNGAAIFRVRIEGRRVEQVASLRGEPPTSSDLMALAPDDTPLVSYKVGSSEIYALNWEAP